MATETKPETAAKPEDGEKESSESETQVGRRKRKQTIEMVQKIVAGRPSLEAMSYLMQQTALSKLGSLAEKGLKHAELCHGRCSLCSYSVSTSCQYCFKPFSLGQVRIRFRSP